MIEVVSITAVRDFTNPEPSPKGHWVEIVIRNDHGLHTLELNGKRPLPDDPTLRSDLEWLLWNMDYFPRNTEVRQRSEPKQPKTCNYLPAKAFLEQLDARQE